jgi:hypothetical protein
MVDHGQGCSVFLMLEEDALASIAWDTALLTALDRLRLHDGMWLWVKLMMPDNYGGWETSFPDLLLLIGAPCLVGLSLVWVVQAGADVQPGPARRLGFMIALALFLGLKIAGRQNLPAWLNPLAHRGLVPSKERCCIVAQVYNPATVGLLSSCMTKLRHENHTDMAMIPCMNAVPQLSEHTYLLLPDLFQHIGVKSTKTCKVGDNCHTLRVAGAYLEEEVARDATDAVLRAAASVPGAHSGWTRHARRAAKAAVLAAAQSWGHAVPVWAAELEE